MHSAPLDAGRAAPLRGGGGETLAFMLFETVGRAIVAGAYLDRSFPSHHELGREYGVSQSVTREAVRMLAAKGILATRPRLGNFVLPYESWNLLDPDVLRWLAACRPPSALMRKLYEFRAAFEPQAAWLAAASARPDQLGAIGRALGVLVGGEGFETQVAFHVSVLRASNNPFFLRYGEVIEPALQVSARRVATDDTRHHRAVYAAIAAGECDKARDAMYLLLAKDAPRPA